MADALETEALWEDFHRVVNMTSAELAAWLRVRDAEERWSRCPTRRAARPAGMSSRSSRSAAPISPTTTSA